MNWTLGDIIILHICINMMYGSWFSYDVWFLRYGPPLLLPPIYPEKQIFDKMKKKPEDIIILQMCTINDNHMMYGFWDKECNRHNFLSFWTVFWPFTSLWPEKIKILKNEKMPGEIILHKCTKNHMLHCSYDTMHDKCNSYFLFWAIFFLFTP